MHQLPITSLALLWAVREPELCMTSVTYHMTTVVAMLWLGSTNRYMIADLAWKVHMFIWRKIGWVLMTLLSLFVVFVASSYLSLDPDVFFPEQRSIYLAKLPMLIMHIAGSMLALALGPFLLLNALRVKWPALHRWLGRAYLLGVLFGGIGGLYMSVFAYTGMMAGSGFAAVGLLWLATGLMAFVRIRDGNVAEHRRWMIRNFSLTLAAVSLRFQAPFMYLLFGDQLGYMIVAWSSWVPNLIIAELLFVQRGQRQPPKPAYSEPRPTI
jgi:hypothetical protein